MLNSEPRIPSSCGIIPSLFYVALCGFSVVVKSVLLPSLLFNWLYTLWWCSLCMLVSWSLFVSLWRCIVSNALNMSSAIAIVRCGVCFWLSPAVVLLMWCTAVWWVCVVWWHVDDREAGCCLWCVGILFFLMFLPKVKGVIWACRMYLWMSFCLVCVLVCSSMFSKCSVWC